MPPSGRRTHLTEPNIKKLAYILSWVPVFVVRYIILGLMGLVIVPIALRFKKWPKVFWLWGNDEEGCPDWWDGSCYEWYATRNSVNNHRFLFKDRPATLSGNWGSGRMEAQDLLNKGVRSANRWATNGIFAGYRRVWLKKPGKYSEYWIGWKVGSGVPGMGFTAQLRLNRDIGT